MPGVYDEKSREIDKQQLKEIEDSFAAPTATNSGSQKLQEQKDLENLYNASDAEESGSDKLQQKNQSDDESSGENGGDSSGSGKSDDNRRSFFKRLATRKNARNAGIAVGAGGGLVGLIVGGSMFMAPLKVVSVVNNMRDEFFAQNDYAASTMDDRLFENYLVKHVIPGLNGTCTTTKIDRSCAVLDPNSKNMVTMLYKAWRTKNLEGRLAMNQGLEIQKRNGKYLLTSPHLRNEIELGRYDGATTTIDGDVYAKLSRTEVRTEVKRAFENETFSRRMRYRFSVGKLMERKYGIRRCLMLCKPYDKVADAFDLRKNAMKLWLTERYIMPHSEELGLAVACALSDFKCADPGHADNHGERRSQFQDDVLNTLQNYRRIYGTHPLADLQKEADKVSANGITQYLVRRIAGDLVGDVFAKITTKFVPIVGWIDAVGNMIETAQKAGPALKHINYVMQASAAVGIANIYFTAGDEIKTGKADLAEAGSVAASLDPNPNNDQGGAGMEASPLYRQVFFNTSQIASSNILDPHAYAASAQPDTSKKIQAQCDDGNGYPLGAIVCPEVGFGVHSTVAKIITTLSEWANNKAATPFTFIADLWNSTFGWAYNHTVGWLTQQATNLAMSAIPDSLKQATMQWIKDNVLSKFFVDMIGDHPSGARMLEVLGLGMNVMAKDDAQFNQGGRDLTEMETTAVLQAEYANRQAEFQSKPLYARMFDTNDNRSLVSRVAVSVPTSGSGMFNTVASMVRNPFSTISHSFSAIFAGPSASALNGAGRYAYGLKTSGYSVKSKYLQPGYDPEKGWEEENCNDPNNVQTWGEKATKIDDMTGMPVQETNNPCMLTRTEVANSGGTSDPTLMMPDDIPANANANTPSVTIGIPSGSAQDLAKQILSNPNISFQTPAERTAMQHIADTGHGVNCGAPAISPTMLGVILKLSQSYKIVVGVVVDGHDCDGGFHPRGAGVDFNGVNPLDGSPGGTGTFITFSAAELPILKQFYQTAGQVLAGIGGGGLGQEYCFQGPAPLVSTPPNVYFDDTCNHIHLDTRGK